MKHRGRIGGHVGGTLLSILTIVLALVMFFPILWMVLTSLKTEADAFTWPPPLFFHPTLEQYDVALGASGYFHYLLNTVVITGASTLVALLLGVPAAYRLAFYPTKRSGF
ncbi:MAG TPA: carbohydrate ABC transporter permease, partial [Spirochaetia bacterium]|nr:carbohydrate ABC transporter permease [Spirochaetia bacterium]